MTTLDDLAVALDGVAAVLAANDSRHGGRWRTQSVAEHVEHAADHLAAWQADDRVENHLPHALCRMMFAVTLAEGLGDSR